MRLSFIIGAVIYFGSVILSQRLGMLATDRLDDETRLKVSKAFLKRNTKSNIILLALVFSFLTAFYLWPRHSTVVLWIFAVTFGIYVIVKLLTNIRKLREINAPEAYVSSINRSWFVFIAGTVVALVVGLLIPA